MASSEFAIITLAIVTAYIALVLAKGFFAYRLMRVNVDDFFVAGRGLGFLVVWLSVVATYHSAFAVLTSTAVASATGVAWWVGSLMWTSVAAIMVWVFGSRFWHLGRRFGYVTLADALADYFESKFLRILVGVIMAVFVIPYITVQAVGFGLMLTIGTEGMVPYELGALVLTIVAMLYCVWGGQRATAWTDVLQGVWMYAAIWIVAILIVQNAVGGIGELVSRVMEVKPELLIVSGKGFSAPLNLVSFVILFGIALPICMQHLQMKFYTARDPKTLRWMSVPSALYLSSIYIPAVFTGLTAAYLIETGQLPPVSEIVREYGTRDALLPLLAVRYAPAILVGFLFAGAIAAAMSTLDNFNIATSVVLTNDVYRKGLGKEPDERRVVSIGRVIIIIFSLLGWLFAILRPGLIFDLVAMSVAGVAQFLPAVIAVTYPTGRPWLTKSGVSAGIIAGVAVTALLLFPDRLGIPIPRNPFSVHAGVWGLIVNFVVAVLVSLFTKPPSKETIERIHGYLDEVV